MVAATGIALTSLRVLLPLIYGLYERGGVGPAAGLAGPVFAAPVLAAAIPRRRSGLATVVGIAAAGRLAIQLVHPTPVSLAAVVAGVALVALVSAVERSPGPVATGLAMGVALDVAVLTVFGTWDPAWQEGAAALVVAMAWGAIALIGSVLRANSPSADDLSRPTWVLGPALLLWIVFLANPASIAATAGIGPAAAAGATLAGCAALVATASLQVEHRAVWTVAAVVTVAAAMLTDLTGWAVVPLVAVAQAGCGLALSLCLRTPRTGGGPGDGVGAALGMLAFAAIAFAYQLDVEQPLPFPRWLLPAAAGGLLSVGALRGARDGKEGASRRARPRGPVAVGVTATIAVVIPFVLPVGEPAAVTRGANPTVRILDWNVHGAVDADGRVDPAALAATIAAQEPDVVVLQEVARGWPIHGELDLAAWLSHALGMPYRWAPAADDRFGNVVLSRLPIVGWEAVPLPYAGGPQHRSFVRLTLDAGGGRTLTVIGTHLQQRAGSDVGSIQAGRLVSGSHAGHATVIAGDLNAQPGDAALTVLTDAGLVSAQDAAGDPGATTARDPTTPGDRVDWIFVSPELRVEAFEVVASDASDHLPLVAVVHLP
ncbi:MAG: endonuclease/exonuclease/phosphatase family protein [Actinomycetota bacterium]